MEMKLELSSAITLAGGSTMTAHEGFMCINAYMNTHTQADVTTVMTLQWNAKVRKSYLHMYCCHGSL